MKEGETERKRITAETEGGKGRVSSLTVSLHRSLDLGNEDFPQQTPGSRYVGCDLVTTAISGIMY